LKHVLVSGLALGGFRAGCPKPHRLVDEEGRLCCRNRLTVRSRCPAAASQRRGAMSRAWRLGCLILATGGGRLPAPVATACGAAAAACRAVAAGRPLSVHFRDLARRRAPFRYRLI